MVLYVLPHALSILFKECFLFRYSVIPLHWPQSKHIFSMSLSVIQVLGVWHPESLSDDLAIYISVEWRLPSLFTALTYKLDFYNCYYIWLLNLIYRLITCKLWLYFQCIYLSWITFGFTPKKCFVIPQLLNFVSYTILGTFTIYLHITFYNLTWNQ